MHDAVVKAERDLLDQRRVVGLVLWGLPLVAILATAFGEVTYVMRGVVWALALAWAGAACVTNACRSGRLHCYITAHFFLSLAGLSLLHGVGVLPLGSDGWFWIGTVLAIGTPLLIVVPERIWGKYSARGEQRCC